MEACDARSASEDGASLHTKKTLLLFLAVVFDNQLWFQ